MDEGLIFIVSVGGAFGLIVVGLGFGAKLGHFRGMYLARSFPGFPSSYIYGAFPIGLGILLLVLAVLIFRREVIQLLIVYGWGGLLLLSFTFMIWKPRWLKPWWLKWLEDHYGHVLEDILEAARNTKDFEQQTRTEADLAAWADSVAEKHNWQRLGEKE